ncbi:MAG: chemotaxis protein CheX [Spirochaetia bacterium]|nr:chemotaxis protein CheX [Spirochaetia bacterium]
MIQIKTTKISETFQQAAVNATLEMFRQVYGRELVYAGSAEKIVGGATQSLNAVINMIGEVAGTVVIQMSTTYAQKLTALMLGSETTPSNEDVHDAMGELLNMIIGSAKNKVSPDPAYFQFSLPTIVSGSGYILYTKAKNKCERVTLCRFSDGSDSFYLEIYLVES